MQLFSRQSWYGSHWWLQKHTPQRKRKQESHSTIGKYIASSKTKEGFQKSILKGKQSSTKGKLKDLTQPPKQNDIRVFLPILSAKGSLFKERISSLQLQITQYLTSWKQLTIQSKQNLYCNVRYMAQVLGVHADSIIQSQVHISHHKPWMQSQGQSNYCGLCAINSAYSNEKLTVDQLDNIADELWLRQIEQFSLDLTDELQIQRDVNGVYSFEVLREVVECFGDQLLNLNELVQEPLVPSDFSSPGKVCICCLGQDFLSLHTNCLLARTSALHFHPYWIYFQHVASWFQAKKAQKTDNENGTGYNDRQIMLYICACQAICWQ